MRDVQGAVTSVLGSKGDEAILDYVVGCLEDEHFEWGPDAEEAFEVFGEMLVIAPPRPLRLAIPPPAACRRQSPAAVTDSSCCGHGADPRSLYYPACLRACSPQTNIPASLISRLCRWTAGA